jgi:hypothetical protein
VPKEQGWRSTGSFFSFVSLLFTTIVQFHTPKMAHRLIKDNQTTGVAIQDWTVLSYKTSILNSQEIDT